jgi:DNA end-binding protein Ku
MAPRAYWKGHLKLSLVSCPIAVNPATTSSERISFRQINKQTGNRLRQQLVDEVTREPVDTADKGRGYEVEKGVYIQIDDDEIEALEIESKHTIEIDSFVPTEQIDKRYYDSPYYIAPNDEVGQEAFAVIREAMRGKGMVALGRIVLHKREHVMALEPLGKGLLGTTLHYAYEVRKAEDYFSGVDDIKVPAEMLKLAEHILDTKKGDFDPAKFEDHFENALVELLRKKQAGFKPPKAKEAAEPARNVISLMDALRRSVQNEKAPQGGKAEASAGKAKKGRKRVAGQTELLLPIQGKGTAREAAAKPRPAAKPAAAKKVAGRRKAG